MRNLLNRYLIAFALCIGFFSWQSCKERSFTGTDMIPPVDGIHTFQLTQDSLDISFSNGVMDSTVTGVSVSGQPTAIALGGLESDPFFGKTNAGIYFQVSPTTGHFYFPDTLTFDSAFVSLPYTGVSFGDTLNPSGNFQQFKVYRITGGLVGGADSAGNDSTVRYTFQDYQIDPTPIGGGTYSLQSMTKSFILGGDTLSNQLRIKLDKNFILNTFVHGDTNNFVNPSLFKSYFNGLYVASDNSNMVRNRLSYFDLGGDIYNQSARIDFYFHDAKGGQKTYMFPYQNLTNAAYSNRIKRTFTGYPANNFLQHKDNRDSLLLQGFPGFYSLIKIKGFNKIPASVINQAQLTFYTVAVGGESKFQVPAQIVLTKVNPDGSIVNIADLSDASGTPSNGGAAFMGGTPEQVVIGGKTYNKYNLNFPRELQNTILSGADSITLRVSIVSPYIGAYRTVLQGLKGSVDTRMKFSIIYTKIN